MKAVNYSWWIGAIVSTILTFAILDADSPNDFAMILFMGVVNGVFWGWIIGLIIDKFRENTLKSNPQSDFPFTQKKKDALKKSLSQQPLKQNGYYISEVQSGDQTLYLVMLFNSRNYVSYDELEVSEYSRATENGFREGITQLEKLHNLEISENITIVHQKGDQLSMKFYDPSDSSNIDPLLKVAYEDPIVYNKWSGRIIPNGLLLDLELSRFSNALKDYEKQNVIQSLKFDFIPINMN
jgi:hypothetical protein